MTPQSPSSKSTTAATLPLLNSKLSQKHPSLPSLDNLGKWQNLLTFHVSLKSLLNHCDKFLPIIVADNIEDLKENIKGILEIGNQLILQHEKDTEALGRCIEEVKRSNKSIETSLKLSKDYEKTVQRSFEVIEELKAENQRLYTLLLQK